MQTISGRDPQIHPIICCASPTRWPSFRCVVKVHPQGGSKWMVRWQLTYNDHRSSLPMLLTIKH
jgi:hypothetical protein